MVKIEMGTSIDGDWAKTGTHIKDGDRIKLLDAGQNLEGKFGAQLVFKILSKREPKGEYNLALNRTSQTNLARGYGVETDAWVGKVARCYVIKQRVGDGLKNVLYLVPDGWEMTDDGEVINPKDDEAPMHKEVEMTEETNDEIAF